MSSAATPGRTPGCCPLQRGVRRPATASAMPSNSVKPLGTKAWRAVRNRVVKGGRFRIGIEEVTRNVEAVGKIRVCKARGDKCVKRGAINPRHIRLTLGSNRPAPRVRQTPHDAAGWWSYVRLLADIEERQVAAVIRRLSEGNFEFCAVVKLETSGTVLQREFSDDRMSHLRLEEVLVRDPTREG